jgi:hypothetical protein
MKIAEVFDVGSVSDGEVRDYDSDNNSFEEDFRPHNESFYYNNATFSNEETPEEVVLRYDDLSYLEANLGMSADSEAMHLSYYGVNPTAPNRSHEPRSP